jgi:hypothetical protein
VARAVLGVVLLVQSLLLLVSDGAADYFARRGLHDAIRLGLGASEALAAALFAWPRTAFLGALLLLPVLGVALGLHLALGEKVGLLPFYVGAVIVLATIPSKRGSTKSGGKSP